MFDSVDVGIGRRKPARSVWGAPDRLGGAGAGRRYDAAAELVVVDDELPESDEPPVSELEPFDEVLVLFEPRLSVL